MAFLLPAQPEAAINILLAMNKNQTEIKTLLIYQMGSHTPNTRLAGTFKRLSEHMSCSGYRWELCCLFVSGGLSVCSSTSRTGSTPERRTAEVGSKM